MRTPIAGLLAACFLVGSNLALAAPQTLWTVDLNNGPGTDFTSIQAAVDAAADGDIVLVREGTYAEWIEIQGKGLSLVSDPSAPTLPRLDRIIVESTPAGSAVSIENFEFECPPGGFGPVVRIAQAAGSVLLEDLTRVTDPCFLSGSQAVQVVDSPAVALNRFTSDTGSLPGPFLLPEATLTLENSTVRVHSSTIFGMRTSALGIPGIRLVDSSLLVEASSVRGGSGGGAQCCGTFGEKCCVFPEPGGNGIEILPSILPGTTLVVDSEIAPWDPTAPGALLASLGYCSCPPSPPGQFDIFNMSPGNHAVQQPAGLARELIAPSPIPSGADMSLELHGLAGDIAFLGYSPTPPNFAGAPLTGVPLLAAGFQILPLGSIPSSGSLTVTRTAPALPAGVGGARMFIQAAVINPGGALRFSNLETLVLLN